MKPIRTLAVPLIVAILLSVGACKQDWTPNPTEEPTDDFPEMSRIVTDANEIIEEEIAKATNAGDRLNPSTIADRVANVDGIVAAEPSPSGAAISIEFEDEVSTDGRTHADILVVRQDRIVLLQDDGANENGQLRSSVSPAKSIFSPTQSQPSSIQFPTGGGRALILAPFILDFNRVYSGSVSAYYDALTRVGYDVTIHRGRAANLDKFRGSYLARFDVVIIETHGVVSHSLYGLPFTMLATGEEISQRRNRSLRARGEDDYLSTAYMSELFGGDSIEPYNRAWYLVTGPWIERTMGGGSLYQYVHSCSSLRVGDVGLRKWIAVREVV